MPAIKDGPLRGTYPDDSDKLMVKVTLGELRLLVKQRDEALARLAALEPAK